MRIQFSTIVSRVLARPRRPLTLLTAIAAIGSSALGPTSVGLAGGIRVHAKEPAAEQSDSQSTTQRMAEPDQTPRSVSAANKPMRLTGSSTPLPPVSPATFALPPTQAGDSSETASVAPQDDIILATAERHRVAATAASQVTVVESSPVESSPLDVVVSKAGVPITAQSVPVAAQVPVATQVPIAAQGVPVAAQGDIVFDGGPVLGPGEVLLQSDSPALMRQAMTPHNFGTPPHSPQFGPLAMTDRVPPVGYDPDAMGCGPQNCRTCYVSAEALYWKQEDDNNFTYTLGRTGGDFDYEWGGRLTIGEMIDCARAWELVYTGPFEWERAASFPGPVNSSLFVLSGAGGRLDTLFNSAFQSQVLQTELNSFEINRRCFASDLFSTLVGFRLFSYNEDYAFLAVANDGGRGEFTNNIDNLLVGGHVGVDMYRPLTQRFSAGFWSRAGVFANFAESDTFLRNRNDLVILSSQDDEDIAGAFQGGLKARYQVLPRLAVTAGYEYLFLAGIASVSDQRPFPLNDDGLVDIRVDDDVFFHGANAGFEFSY